jgi:hypothetical protein
MKIHAVEQSYNMVELEKQMEKEGHCLIGRVDIHTVHLMATHDSELYGII